MLFARQLAEQYRAIAASLEEEAREVKESMPLTRRLLRQYAVIARRAAYAEELDPEPKA